MCRKFQLLRISTSRDIIAFVPLLGNWSHIELFVWVSCKNRGFNIFWKGLSHYSLNAFLYNIYLKKSVTSFDLTEQAFYGPGCSLYEQAHIHIESETLGESILADFVLIFSLDRRPQRVLWAPICQLSDYAISWEIAISKNLDLHQKPIFGRIVGTKRNGAESWNFQGRYINEYAIGNRVFRSLSCSNQNLWISQFIENVDFLPIFRDS